jgi:cell division protein FtsA
VKHEETIEVPSVGGRPPRLLSRQILCEIIEPRVAELFEIVQQRIKSTASEDMIASGVVLTGGTALLEGMQDAAEKYLGMPIRQGKPRNIGGLQDVVNSPIYATGVGLVLHGAENYQASPVRFAAGGIMSRIWKAVSDFI